MTTGLVLSGGGIRGIAHIGAIKALEEYGIYPSQIAGTSAGAIVGALYAAGCSCNEMLDFFKTTQIFSLNNYAMGKPGFLDTEKFYDQFRTYLPHDSFELLEKRLYITATNLLDGTLKVFDSGELIRPVLASAAVPGLFAPMKIENGYYIDGGTLNNFPVDLIRRNCDRIVGVYVNPFNKVNIDDLNHVNKVLERTYHVMMSNETSLKFIDCDLLIRPININRYGMFSLKNIDSIFHLGYTAASKALKESTLSSELLLAAELEAMNGFSINT
ncbi:patatin [Arenibacter sp. TNZ]|jgi:NTE family protein|uniref:patatin-like phospholipase family protein n=1 Tax=Arenibacter TaxID=178469 RepID=UPI000CD48801|nr:MULTISPECIES: patatin-like phospholipase family protein [Arenibacter]MCM4173310.1 patatin [Arenibacter sp. TNZ]